MSPIDAWGRVAGAARLTARRRVGAGKSPIPPDSVAYSLREARAIAEAIEYVVQDVWFEEGELSEMKVNRFGVKLVDDGGFAELTGKLPWLSGKKATLALSVVVAGGQRYTRPPTSNGGGPTPLACDGSSKTDGPGSAIDIAEP